MADPTFNYETVMDIKREGEWVPVGSKVTLGFEEAQLRLRDGTIKPLSKSAADPSPTKADAKVKASNPAADPKPGTDTSKGTDGTFSPPAVPKG